MGRGDLPRSIFYIPGKALTGYKKYDKENQYIRSIELFLNKNNGKQNSAFFDYDHFLDQSGK